MWCEREWATAAAAVAVAVSLCWVAMGVQVAEAAAPAPPPATKLPLNGLVYDFYGNHTKCPKVEKTIRSVVKKAWKADRSITPALLRIVYSDCFVGGCDASILLDGKSSEKTAPQNAGLRGFELIDAIKKKMESRCPGVVSCSDILHLAARDAVSLAGGWQYPVFTGRRDGNSSKAETVDLPPSSISWSAALAYFQSRGLNELDLGTLLGAHTMGVTHCRYVRGRIYNFNDTGLPDGQMDCRFARQLAAECPYKQSGGRIVDDPAVFLNPDSGGNYTFTNSYYKQVLAGRAVLGIDQQLSASTNGRRIAEEFAGSFKDFKLYFAFAMNRMGSLGVLTGARGEIRKNCRFSNAH